MFQKQPPEVSRKTPESNFFFDKFAGLRSKNEDPNTVVFQWILRNF